MEFDKPLDEVEGGDFELIPVGQYLGFVEEAEEKESSSGNDMLVLKVRLAGNEKFNNRMLFYYLVKGGEYFLPNAKKLVMALRLDIKGMTELKPEAVVDLPCKFQIKHEVSQGGSNAGSMTEKLHYFVHITGEEAASVNDNAPSAKYASEEIPDEMAAF